MKKSKAIFLDRDGVINRLMLERGPRETPLVADDFKLLPKVKQSLERLKKAGFLLIIVTNQPNVFKGKSSWEDFRAIEVKMHRLIGPKIKIDEVFACLHHTDPKQAVVQELLKDCDCRKPKPGLILQAVNKHPIDLVSSWLVGDAKTDIEAGLAAGLQPNHLIFIGEKYNDEIIAVRNLWEASQIILK